MVKHLFVYLLRVTRGDAEVCALDTKLEPRYDSGFKLAGLCLHVFPLASSHNLNTCTPG